MTTTQTDAIMALADRYAFHIPGSQHSDEARAALLAALQEQAREGEVVAIKDAVGCVLEGWTLPDPVRKILETAYYAAPQPAQEPTSAVPVVEQLVGALSCNRIMAADSDGNYTKEVTPRIITAALAAGQQFLRESGE